METEVSELVGAGRGEGPAASKCGLAGSAISSLGVVDGSTRRQPGRVESPRFRKEG
jgi:hypothetical protein